MFNCLGRTGMMYEIGNLIAAEAGFTYTNEIIPYARTVLVVASGDADLLALSEKFCLHRLSTISALFLCLFLSCFLSLVTA